MNFSNGSAAEIKKALQAFLTGEFRCKVREHEPLSKHTTFKIGGPADLWLEPQDLESLQRVIGVLNHLRIPYFLIGEGSNLLVSDQGFRGAMIHLDEGFNLIECHGTSLICGAAAKVRDLANYALKSWFQGVASLFGIPGSLGGGVVMNAGAYGATLSDTLEWVEAIEPDGTLLRMNKNDLTFGYRKAPELQGKVVTSLSFGLTPGDPGIILAEMERVTKRRAESQPLEFPSAGSVFKRPPGDYAGRILEAVGAKGFSIGGAEVSSKHANFIINRGDATAADVLAVIKELKKRVLESFGINLELEIKQVGFGSEEATS
jgi:UDP-N-acetylmuramate dehydrogenase